MVDPVNGSYAMNHDRRLRSSAAAQMEYTGLSTNPGGSHRPQPDLTPWVSTIRPDGGSREREVRSTPRQRVSPSKGTKSPGRGRGAASGPRTHPHPVANPTIAESPATPQQAPQYAPHPVAPAQSPASVAVSASASPTMTSASQLQLVSQLHEVVLRLSHGALSEKQQLAGLQQRLDAYAALVKEQDRMIDDLRAMNARLEREREALIAFRRQDLRRDLHLLNGRNAAAAGGSSAMARGGRGGGVGVASAFSPAAVEELVRTEYARSNGLSLDATKDFIEVLHPRGKKLVLSLAARLLDERARRLDAEEQCSAMLGEQQLAMQRMEARLEATSTTGGSHSAWATPLPTPRMTSNVPRAPASPGSPFTDPMAQEQRVNSGNSPRMGDLDSPVASVSSSESPQMAEAEEEDGVESEVATKAVSATVPALGALEQLAFPSTAVLRPSHAAEGEKKQSLPRGHGESAASAPAAAAVLPSSQPLHQQVSHPSTSSDSASRGGAVAWSRPPRSPRQPVTSRGYARDNGAPSSPSTPEPTTSSADAAQEDAASILADIRRRYGL